MYDDPNVGVGKRLRALGQRMWTDREIIVRSDGQVNYLRFGRGSQLAMMVPVILAIGGAAHLYQTYHVKSATLEQRDREIAEAGRDYVALMAEVADYQARIAALVEQGRENQERLLALVENGQAPRDTVAEIRTELDESAANSANTAVLRQALRRRVDQLQEQLNRFGGAREDLERQITVLRGKLEGSDGDREQIAAARDALQHKIRSLRTELLDMGQANEELERTVADLRGKLEQTQLDRDELTASLAETDQSLVEALDEKDALAVQTRELSGELETTRTALGEARTEKARLADSRIRLEEELAEAETQLTAARDRAKSLDTALSDVRDELDQIAKVKTEMSESRDDLADQVADYEGALRASRKKNALLESELAQAREALDSAIADRRSVSAEKVALTERLSALETTYEQLTQSQVAILDRIATELRDNASIFEDTIKMAGLNAGQLLAQASDGEVGRGGPFVAAVDGVEVGKALESGIQRLDQEVARFESLRRIVRAMPLMRPVDRGRLTSGFGKRIDPINGRPAMHYGQDFAAPTGTTIRVPADGKVTFAGWKGNYGRFVEVDHGNGIRTRFGHLHKIDVKKGQVVEFRDKLGQLGNSGRSTGPHLHYEVTVNGRPVNPGRFLKAGHYVLKK